MKIRLLTKIILCGALAVSTHASPINFSQIGDSQSGRQTNGGSTSQSTSASSDTINGSVTVESLEQPEFVRLADGRMIPYGPGVVCSESCVESAVEPPGFPRKWLIALPLVGAAIVGVLLTSDSPRIPRSAVDEVIQPPTPDPVCTTPPCSPLPPSPTPVCTGGNCTPTPVEPVPEPATLALMGAGLAVLSRRRVMKFVKRNKK